MRNGIRLLVTGGLVAATSLAWATAPADRSTTAGALTTFDGCADALTYLKNEALERIQAGGLDGTAMIPNGSRPSAEAGTEETAVHDAGESGTAPDVALQHSTTNVQEAGVEEPDVVKTDGRIAVTTQDGTLRVIDVSVGTPSELGQLELPGDDPSPTLLLADERAMVFLEDRRATPQHDDTGPETAPSASLPPVARPDATTVLQVDIADPTQPSVESTFTLEARLLDARLTDGTVRLATTSTPTLTEPGRHAPPGTDSSGDDQSAQRQRAAIENSTIDDWLPEYRLDTGDERSSGQLLSCDRLHHPADLAAFSVLSVLSFDLADGPSAPDEEQAATGVLGAGETVYASTDRLYVATSRWSSSTFPSSSSSPWSPSSSRGLPPRDPASTGVHAFDITGATATYVASGEVDGRIIGRYALSEHEGVLRVAATNDGSGDPTESESHLVTLREQDDELVEAGRVDGLGRGEQIYAVRYSGDTGYVVTFREIDPLYVLDLTDPADPSVSGELKITGYSSYLHHLGDGRLIGVGQEATTEGRTIGAQISLFDVSSPASPTKLDGHVVSDTWSSVEHEPKAFLHWPDTDQIVVPLEGGAAGGAQVLGVDDDTLNDDGRITRIARAGADSSGDAGVVRSFVVGDSLYTLWRDGLQANDLEDLEPEQWLAFG